jgi:hypothetical protein
MTVLVIEEAPPHKNGESRAGMYVGYIGDDLIVASKQPFLDGARALIAAGYDPDEPYNMRREGSDTLSFVTTTIGHAAAFSVSEDGNGMRFKKEKTEDAEAVLQTAVENLDRSSAIDRCAKAARIGYRSFLSNRLPR